MTVLLDLGIKNGLKTCDYEVRKVTVRMAAAGAGCFNVVSTQSNEIKDIRRLNLSTVSVRVGPHRLLSPCSPTPASVFIRTIRPLFHGRPATMAGARIWSPWIGLRVAVIW